MNKFSKFFADLSATCNEQAIATLAKLTDETSAEQRAKIVRAANNLSKIDADAKISTTHEAQLKALSELVENKEVAKLFRDCKIDPQVIAGLSKYNKQKINASFNKLASSSAPDWTKNHENLMSFFELQKKLGMDSVTLQQIQRFLDHDGNTQAGMISVIWRALGVATQSGRGEDRVLKVNRDSLLAQHVARIYKLSWIEQQDESAASA